MFTLMESRDQAKPEEVIAKLRKEMAKMNIFYFPLDLCSKTSVERFAECVLR